MLYVLGHTTDGRFVEITTKLNFVDKDSVDLMISEDTGEEDSEKVTCVQVKLEDLYIATRAMLMERSRIKK